MNILWIVLDHVTFRHYKMTRGARPLLNTYEKLAKEGVEFTECRSVHPLCLPARASMLTGVYAHKNRKVRNASNFADAGYPVFQEYLKRAGFAVGYFGKNHSGFDDFEKRGIEGFYPKGYGNPYLSREYSDYLKRRQYQNPVYCQEWHLRDMGHDEGEYDLTKVNNFNTYSAGYLAGSEPVHESDFLTDLAGSWIEETVRSGKPFAVRLDTWGPHQAYQVPQEFRDTIDVSLIEEYPGFRELQEGVCSFTQDFTRKIREHNDYKTWDKFRKVVGRAYEHYTYIDRTVGRFLDRLKELGIYDDTAVIMTADHGDSLGSHGGMFDKCGDMTEELMSVPLVIKAPLAAGGKKCSALVNNMDIMPTVMELAGCPVPEYVDGLSLLPLLQDPDGSLREDMMCEHYGHFDVYKVQRAVYYKQYKYIAVENDLELLYDLENDPFEMKNLACDGGARNTLEEMRRRLKLNILKYGDTFETAALLK